MIANVAGGAGADRSEIVWRPRSAKCKLFPFDRFR